VRTFGMQITDTNGQRQLATARPVSYTLHSVDVRLSIAERKIS